MCHIAYLIKCITLPSTLVSPKLLHSVTDICFFLLIKVYLPFSSLQAMSILLLPHNIPDSLKHLSTLVDDIWYYAGDRSTDVSRPSQPKYPSPHVFLTSYYLACLCKGYYSPPLPLSTVYSFNPSPMLYNIPILHVGATDICLTQILIFPSWRRF